MEVPLYGEKINNCISHCYFFGFESIGSIVFTVLNGFFNPNYGQERERARDLRWL